MRHRRVRDYILLPAVHSQTVIGIDHTILDGNVPPELSEIGVKPLQVSWQVNRLRNRLCVIGYALAAERVQRFSMREGA